MNRIELENLLREAFPDNDIEVKEIETVGFESSVEIYAKVLTVKQEKDSPKSKLTDSSLLEAIKKELNRILKGKP